MSKPRVLIQLDPDPQPSTFDAVVAIDAGADQLLRHGGVAVDAVRDLVYGAIFTRGPEELANTAIFVGGSDVAAGEALFNEVKRTFFGPMRVSVMLDANGSNTTAAAAVLAAAKHVKLAGATAVVLGGTGPVGQRAARLLLRERAKVRVGSRTQQKAEAACRQISQHVAGSIEPMAASDEQQLARALEGASIVIAAGAPGVVLLPAAARRATRSLEVAIDLNAVPPLGIEGVEVMDKAADREGVVCYGAVGVGGLKMRIHKAALARLFKANDLLLDAEEVLDIGRNGG